MTPSCQPTAPRDVATGAVLSTLHGRRHVVLIRSLEVGAVIATVPVRKLRQRGSVPHPRSHDGGAGSKIAALGFHSQGSARQTHAPEGLV